MVFSARLPSFSPLSSYSFFPVFAKLMKRAEAGTGSVFKVSALEEACEFLPERRSPLRSWSSGSLICPRGDCQKTDPFHLLQGSLLIPVSHIYLISKTLFDDSESLPSSSLFAVHLSLFSLHHHIHSCTVLCERGEFHVTSLEKWIRWCHVFEFIGPLFCGGSRKVLSFNYKSQRGIQLKFLEV